jgi:hypothetical protein
MGGILWSKWNSLAGLPGPWGVGLGAVEVGMLAKPVEAASVDRAVEAAELGGSMSRKVSKGMVDEPGVPKVQSEPRKTTDLLSGSWGR